MLLPPLLGFECDGDVNGGVGERAGQKSLRGLESVHQGVAVGEEKSRGPRSVALLVDEGQQRRFQSRAGRLEVSEVRWMKSSAPSAFSVSNATISTSVKRRLGAVIPAG